MAAPQLSVNINKVATLRNARGGQVPSLIRAVETIVDAGCTGITVHPREDERHITAQDVLDVHARIERYAAEGKHIEYNIEGDPRPALMEVVERLAPTQCTLVPVRPGEITSEAGWTRDQGAALPPIIERLKARGIRVSVFVEAKLDAITWAAEVGADRVELYTEPYAKAFAAATDDAQRQASFERYAEAARAAAEAGLGVNAGHDLDLANLPLFAKLPHLDEVSIGHALMSEALFRGLAPVVRDYLAVLAPST